MSNKTFIRRVATTQQCLFCIEKQRWHLKHVLQFSSIERGNTLCMLINKTWWCFPSTYSHFVLLFMWVMLCVSTCHIICKYLRKILIFAQKKKMLIFCDFYNYFFCRIFHVEKLMNTNLIFIMVESKGTCPCDTRLLIQAEQTCILWHQKCLESNTVLK